MKTSVMEVRDMLSVLSALGVEQRIGEVPGVESVTVNHAAGTATVRYDETRLDVADIKSDVRQNAYEEAAPAAPGPAGGGRQEHANPGATKASLASEASISPPGTPATVWSGAAAAPSPDKAAAGATPSSASPPAPDTGAPMSVSPDPVGDGKNVKAP